MKATDLLKAQHREVERLFKSIEKAEDKGEKRELFEKLAQNLVGHDAIEREIFYPACEKQMGMTDLLGEALVEHGLVEFSLYRADQALGQKDFEHRVTVLKETIAHHVEEEEEELFPKVEKALGSELLQQLCARMERRFEQAMTEDFRGPLADNLRQVLDGKTKTKPSNGVKKKAPKKAAKRASTPKSAPKSAPRTQARAARSGASARH
jgi:hemerythrin superfamily protein